MEECTFIILTGKRQIHLMEFKKTVNSTVSFILEKTNWFLPVGHTNCVAADSSQELKCSFSVYHPEFKW